MPNTEGGTDMKHSLGDLETLQRKKFKASELPISASQRAAVDGLLYSFKKKGGFDLTRKQIWAEFDESVQAAKDTFTASLNEMGESEIDRDSSLLSRDRGKAATLIEGAVDRSDLYKSVEEAIDSISSNYLGSILSSIRTIRLQEVGEEKALKEEKAGGITDENYEDAIQEKREKRDQARKKERETQEQREAEEAKAKAEEVRRRRESQRKEEEEARRKRKERDEQRRAERVKLREEQIRLDEAREKEREERYERRRREDKERYKDSIRCRDDRDNRDYDRAHSKRHDLDWNHGNERSASKSVKNLRKDGQKEPDRSGTPKKPSPYRLDEKSLEDAALELLLREGKELAEKSRQRPEFDFEQAEALEEDPNQQTQMVGSESKASRPDPARSHAPQASPGADENVSPRERGNGRQSRNDLGRRRGHERTSSSHSSDARYSSRHDQSISRHGSEREQRHREERDEETGLHRSSDRVRRDTEENFDPHFSSRYGRSRSRSTIRGRGGKSEGYRDHEQSGDDRGRQAARERERRVKGEDREKECDRPNDRGTTREMAYDHDHGSVRDDERSYRPRRVSRSRSAHRRRRSRSRSRPLSRARSPTRRVPRNRERSTSRARYRSDSRSNLDIDRYIPSTSNRSRSPKRRERDREDRGRCDIDRYVPR